MPLNQEERIELTNLEKVACNLCGSYDNEILATRSRFRIPLNTAICRHCGLMYINPRMSQQQYKIFYKSIYRKQFLQTKESTQNIFEKKKGDGAGIMQFCQPHFGKGLRVLDVGCGPGGILACLKEHGMEVYGIEPSEEESSFARKQGLPVDAIMLEDLKEEEKNYEAIVLSSSLNHFANPSSALEKIWKLLTPDGYLFLLLLDFPAQCRFGFIEECAQADHLYMFCPETVERLLAKTGFKIIKTDASKNNFSPWRDLWSKPSFHFKILAQKTKPQSLTELDAADYQQIKQRMKRHQKFFLIRRLRLASTYRHWLKLLIQKIAGPKTVEMIKKLAKRQKENAPTF